MAKKIKKEEKSEKEILEEINSKLNKLIGLVAVSTIKEQKKKIPILKNLGFTIEETVALTGLTIDIVKKERGKLKKK